MPNVQFNHCGSEVTDLAADLIVRHHKHLKDVRIEYLFRSEPETVRGSVVLATAKKVSGLNAFLASDSDGEEFELEADAEGDPNAFFVIQIWGEAWLKITPEQQVALVDHELCHCRLKLDGSLYIAPHDLEEFRDIVERHGLWKPDVAEFVRVAAKHDALAAMRNDKTMRKAIDALKPKPGSGIARVEIASTGMAPIVFDREYRPEYRESKDGPCDLIVHRNDGSGIFRVVDYPTRAEAEAAWRRFLAEGVFE